jgi:hypothetical protein
MAITGLIALRAAESRGILLATRLACIGIRGDCCHLRPIAVVRTTLATVGDMADVASRAFYERRIVDIDVRI